MIVPFDSLCLIAIISSYLFEIKHILLGFFFPLRFCILLFFFYSKFVLDSAFPWRDIKFINKSKIGNFPMIRYLEIRVSLWDCKSLIGFPIFNFFRKFVGVFVMLRTRLGFLFLSW